MNVYLSDSASEGAGVPSRSERRSQAPAYVSAAEADPGGGDPAAVQGRTVAIPEQREALALEQRSPFAGFKERARVVLSKYSGKVLDGLLGGAPAGVYAAFAERTIREEDAAAGGRPARAATPPNGR